MTNHEPYDFGNFRQLQNEEDETMSQTPAIRAAIVKTIDNIIGNRALTHTHDSEMAYIGLLDDLGERFKEWEQQIVADARQPTTKWITPNPIDYSPFDGDGRTKVYSGITLPNTLPTGIAQAQCRVFIDNFLQSGHSSHSGMGATLWVLLTWLQTHKVPYTLRAVPGDGYYIIKGI